MITDFTFGLYALTIHRWFRCGPGRAPTAREVDEARVWICPTCRAGRYADGDEHRRYWVSIR